MALQNRGYEELGDDSDEDLSNTLTEYDKNRHRVSVIRGRSIVLNTKMLTTELSCPICLDLLTTTMTSKECLHRFCYECISTALKGNKECPTCRTKIVSMRDMRRDANFDTLIKQIYPDRRRYEEQLEVANQGGDDPLANMAAFADDEEFDKDAPTPPALLESRDTTPALESFESGRRTPPWFTAGDLNPNEMDAYEKGLFLEAQKAYLKLRSRRVGSRIAALDRIFDCDATTDTVSMGSGLSSRRTFSPPHEPPSKQRKATEGGSKKLSRDDAKSVGSSADSGESSDDEETGQVTVEAELDKEGVEEEDAMQRRMFLVDTSREVKKTGPVGSVQTVSGTPAFDPRVNPAPPYPEALEQFAELIPGGKGDTWLAAAEQPVEQPQEVNSDEEQVFDEDDVLSIVSIDDMLQEMGEVTHENDVEKDYAEVKPDGVFADLTKMAKEDKRNKYMCEETRHHLRELNELRAGGLADLKPLLECSEQFDIDDATTWYAQQKDGEEMIYYEKGKQPFSRGRLPVTKEYDVAEEAERVGRRVTLKDIRDDMSGTDSDHTAPCTASLASSPDSSILTLSEEGVEAVEESAAELPPFDPEHAKEHLDKWIGDPATPEHLDTNLDRSMDEESTGGDCESLPDDYELEVELRPAASMMTRNGVPTEMLQKRYIRTQNDTTMEHITEYLYQRWLEELQTSTETEIPRPEHFFVFNRSDCSCRCVLLHECLSTAQSLTARNEHVVVYYDTQRAEISAEEMSLLDKIVPHADRVEPAPASPGASTGSSSSQ